MRSAPAGGRCAAARTSRRPTWSYAMSYFSMSDCTAAPGTQFSGSPTTKAPQRLHEMANMRTGHADRVDVLAVAGEGHLLLAEADGVLARADAIVDLCARRSGASERLLVRPRTAELGGWAAKERSGGAPSSCWST